MKLVTWNTQWCCGLDGMVSPQRIVDGARAMADFDVLCLQEIAQGFDDMPARRATSRRSCRRCCRASSSSSAPRSTSSRADGRRQRFGNLIATRLPVAQVQHHALPWPADAGVRSMPRMCTRGDRARPACSAPVRVMTTHLEYYSSVQRMAQARALRALHIEACAQAAAPPPPEDDGSPFQAKLHTPNAILCGDFNLGPSEPEYAVIRAPFGASRARGCRMPGRWCTAGAPHDAHLPPVRPEPTGPSRWPAISSSSAMGSRRARAAHRRRRQTQASDHQPVLLVLGSGA